MNLPRIVRALPLLLCLVASAQDVTSYGVAKQRRYEQLGTGAPTPRSSPFRFNTFVNTQVGGLASGSVKLPGGSVQPVQPDGDSSWRIKADYLSQAGLDADFPNGTYTLALKTAHDGTKVINLPLTGNAYPNVPQVLNFTAAQTVNPAAAFTVTWSAFAGGTINDFVQLSVDSSGGGGMTTYKTASVLAPGSLNGTATSAMIPAGVLAANTSYQVNVTFAKITTMDTTSYGQGVTGVAGYTSETRFTLVTGNATKPDVKRFFVAKDARYQQSGPGTPVLAGQPYQFLGAVKGDAANLISASMKLPSGTPVALSPDGNQLALKAKYLSSGGLNADFPDGTYTFTIQTAHDGTRTVPLALTGGSFPNTPQLVNFAAAQAVNAGSPFTATWNPFIGGTAADYVNFEVIDASDNTVIQAGGLGSADALTGASPSSFTIPANTLAPGTAYTIRLLFARITQKDSTSYGQGVTGSAAYSAQTQIPLVTAAPLDVRSFGVVKGLHYQQAQQGAAPVIEAGQPYKFIAFVEAENGSVSGGSLKRPNGATQNLVSNNGDTPRLFVSYLTAAGLDADYPPGSYTLTLNTAHNGSPVSTLPLPASAFPVPPQVQNFNAAQAVNPAAAFTVTWNTLIGGTVNDYAQLQVDGPDGPDGGDTVYQSPPAGEPGALNGTATSFTIPANKLAAGQTYQARVLFAHSLGQSTSYSSGFSAYYSQTGFPLKTTGSADTTPPSLLTSTPANGAQNVPRNSAVSFQFSEPMQPSHSISWSGNTPADNFTYTWSGDQRTLTATYAGDLPAASTISWVLNPSGFGGGFRDVAGNFLPRDIGGGFTTGGGVVTGPDVQFYGVVKGVNYEQSSAAPPVPEATPYRFNAFADIAVGGLSGASIRLPTGATQTLSPDHDDSWNLEQSFPSQAALDAARPDGAYRFTLNAVHDGTHTATLNLTGNRYPNAPQLLNFTAGQSIDPTKPFTVTWNAFTGGLAGDFIRLSLHDQSDGNSVFDTPEAGKPGRLGGTATGVTIPAGTLTSGHQYQAGLLFAAIVQADTISYGQGVIGVAAYFADTKSTLTTTGFVVVIPTLTIERTGESQWHLHATGASGRNYAIESTTDLTPPVNWQPMVNFNGSATGFDFTDGVVRTHNFYRVRPTN